MDMSTIRWILIGLVIAFILGFAFIQPLVKKFRMERDNTPEQKTFRVTCTVPSCEVFYKRINHDSRYCKFHDKIHEIYLKLVALDSPAKHRAEVYFNTNGMFYADENQQMEVIKDLEKEVTKAEAAKGKATAAKVEKVEEKIVAEKPVAKKKTTTTKKPAVKKATPAKKATTTKKASAKKPVAKKTTTAKKATATKKPVAKKTTKK